jgi:hypothetical protein
MMKSSRKNKTFIVCFLFLLFSVFVPVSGTGRLTVETDNVLYAPGEEIKIFGQATPSGNVSILVDSTGGKIFDLNITSDVNGKYEAHLTLPSNVSEGVFDVIASSIDAEVRTIFTITHTDLRVFSLEILSRAENLRRSIEEYFYEIEKEGLFIPADAKANYSQGLKDLNVAESKHSQEDFTSAVQFAFQALDYFAKSFEMIQELIPERTSGEFKDFAEKAISLEAGINRAQELIGKMNSAIGELEERDYPISEIRDNISKAEEHLASASSNLEIGDLTTANKELTDSNEIIGSIKDHIHSSIQELKIYRVERFIDSVENQIKNIEDKIELLGNRVEEEKISTSINIINKVGYNVSELKNKVSVTELEYIVEKLEEAVNEIEAGLNELDGEGNSDMLLEINKIETRIQVLNETAENLLKKGEDPSELKEELESANKILEGMVKEFEEGNQEDFQDLAEEAEKSLTEASEKLSTRKTGTQSTDDHKTDETPSSNDLSNGKTSLNP